MFDDFTRYPRPKVKLFFRYLISAASKEYAPPQEKQHVFLPEELIQEREMEVALRLAELSEGRREELETKIKAYYSKNKYLPLELRLKKLKKKYSEMRKSKDYGKLKINKIKEKIERCKILLHKIEKLDLLSKNN